MSRKRTPDQDTQAETSTTPSEPPAPEVNGDGQSFVDRVGQRDRVSPSDPFGIAGDYVAGVRLFESKRDRQMAIKFGEGRPEDKPSQAVIDKLKDAGYRWKPADRIWAHPVRHESAMSTRIEAEQLYQKVREMMRQEKGIATGQDIPF
jgi:hypothetical protein